MGSTCTAHLGGKTSPCKPYSAIQPKYRSWIAELAAELGGLGEMEALQDDGKIMATGMFNNYPIIINIRICLYLQYLMITVIFWELPIMIISITISDSCVPISVAIWGCIHPHPF